jgi:hypothetical protein
LLGLAKNGRKWLKKPLKNPAADSPAATILNAEIHFNFIR